MKAHHNVSFGLYLRTADAALGVLKLAGVLDCKYSINTRYNRAEVLVPYGDVRLQSLLSVVSEHRFEPIVYIQKEYSRKEIDDAALLEILIVRGFVESPPPPDDADWDLAAMCSECGAGAIQLSGKRMKPPRSPGPEMVWTDQDELHVSSRLKVALENQFGPMPVFKQDMSWKGNDRPLDWWQILPAVSQRSLGLNTRLCPACGRKSYFSSAEHPFQLTYELSAAEVEQLPPFCCTEEYFGDAILNPGRNEIRSFPRRRLLINRECRLFLRKYGLKILRYDPINVLVRPV